MTWAWIWIASLLIVLISEAIINKNIALWLAPASLVALVLDIAAVDFIWQLLSFTILAVPAHFLLKKYSFPIPGSAKSTTDIDTVVGKRCTVTERIDTYAGCGQVDVKGTKWSARGLLEDDTFEAGDSLIIVAVEGVKLICKKPG